MRPLHCDFCKLLLPEKSQTSSPGQCDIPFPIQNFQGKHRDLGQQRIAGGNIWLHQACTPPKATRTVFPFTSIVLAMAASSASRTLPKRTTAVPVTFPSYVSTRTNSALGNSCHRSSSDAVGGHPFRKILLSPSSAIRRAFWSGAS